MWYCKFMFKYPNSIACKACTAFCMKRLNEGKEMNTNGTEGIPEYARSHSSAVNNNMDLLIELPEETDDWYKTEDVKEKIEFVASKMGFTYEQFIMLLDSIKGIRDNNRVVMQALGDMKNDLQNICARPKHEFKPFDKVLVRDIDSIWSAAHYSHYDKEEDKHSCGGVLFDECIPYAGHEYLVGTTDKPKELC